MVGEEHQFGLLVAVEVRRAAQVHPLEAARKGDGAQGSAGGGVFELHAHRRAALL
jgi:hypothetical protein